MDSIEDVVLVTVVPILATLPSTVEVTASLTPSNFRLTDALTASETDSTRSLTLVASWFLAHELFAAKVSQSKQASTKECATHMVLKTSDWASCMDIR